MSIQAWGGNQVFTIIGGAAFDGPGQVRYFGGILEANVNASLGSAEFQVQLTGAPAFVAADLIA